MPTRKAPVVRNLKVVPPPAHAVFAESLPGGNRSGQYERVLSSAAKSDQVVEIAASDRYVLAQLRDRARKLKIRLLYATDSSKIWIRPVSDASAAGERKRLLLMLRDRRTLAWLESQKLHLPLKEALNALAAEKLAHFHKDAWCLTEKGHDAVIDPAAMAATA